VAVDDVGQLPFERAAGFSGGLVLELAAVVGLSGGVPADLGDCGDVQHGVEPAVAPAREPMPVDVTG
jgi:hypothetical protein